MTWLVAVVLASASSVNPLVQLSGSIEALVKQVSPTVVQVVVTAYTTVDQGNRAQAERPRRRRRSSDSGCHPRRKGGQGTHRRRENRRHRA